jgi:phospholipid/cholesterol/gamma-HCH transport system substrate-binding protein
MLKNGAKIQITQSAVVLERLIGQFLFDKAQGGGDKPAAGGDKTKAGADKIPDSIVPAKK